MKNLEITSKELLQILSNKQIVHVSDWDKLVQLAGRTGFGPYLYHLITKDSNIEKSQIPQNAYKTLENTYFYCLGKAIYHKNLLLSILDSFNKNNIDVISVKGIVLSEILYGAPELRSLPSDIDLLMKKKDERKITIVLKEIGYNLIIPVYWSSLYTKKNWPFMDIHWMYCAKEEAPIDMKDPWERVKTINIDNTNIKILSPEDMIIYLTFMTNNDCCRYLRHFYDLHLALGKYKDILDWAYIIKKIKRYKLKGVFYLPFKYVKIMFETDIPYDIIKLITPGFIRRKILDKALDPRWPIETIKPGKKIKPLIEGAIISGGYFTRFIFWAVHKIWHEYSFSNKKKPVSFSSFMGYCYKKARGLAK
jgi:hypothetical protein